MKKSNFLEEGYLGQQGNTTSYTQVLILLYYYRYIIEEYSAKRGLSPQIMKIELVSISATESSFLHSVKVSYVRVTLGSLQANDKQNHVLPFFSK